MKRKKKEEEEEKRQQQRGGGPPVATQCEAARGVRKRFTSLQVQRSFQRRVPNSPPPHPCGDEVCSSSGGEQTRHADEGGSGRSEEAFSPLPAERHAEQRGEAVDKEETKAAAAGFFLFVGWSAVRNGGGWGVWGVLGLQSCNPSKCWNQTVGYSCCLQTADTCSVIQKQ